MNSKLNPIVIDDASDSSDCAEIISINKNNKEPYLNKAH